MANEKRLIDPSNIIRSLKSMASEYDAITLPGMIKALQEEPTVDAVEVVHGRWIPSKSMALSDKCSVCHGWVTRHSVNERIHRYCPNCGAKMDGGNADGAGG